MSLFSFDWDAPLDNAEKDLLLNRLADQIAGRGIGVPAQWILEVHRPLANVAGQFAISFSPLLAPLFTGGAVDMQKYTKLLQDRSNIDTLIDLIEQKMTEATVAAR
jgi:hypothetical protein